MIVDFLLHRLILGVHSLEWRRNPKRKKERKEKKEEEAKLILRAVKLELNASCHFITFFHRSDTSSDSFRMSES